MSIVNKIKKVKIQDIFGSIVFLILVIPAFIYKIYMKIRKKELWVICETDHTARDNGIVFFKYMLEKHPEIKSYYAIKKSSKDYEKISEYKNIIEWGSLKHYLYYMSATYNISSHKSSNPNQTLFTILHLYLNLYNNQVFLQHGVLYQNFSMFHKKNSKFKIFICGAKPEYEFVKEKYGYKNEVKYTGLARFDNLHHFEIDNKMILYMPTWRRYLLETSKLENSIYYKNIMSFINSKELENILEKEDKYLYFYPHQGLRNVNNSFKTSNSRVKILDFSCTDIQELLKKGAMLITDFSSLHTDFAYMHKPVIYYQYDKEEYKIKHVGIEHDDTYFDFERDGFGPVISDEKELLKEIEKEIKSNYSEDEKYLRKIDSFFELYDEKNCERIYDVIKE